MKNDQKEEHDKVTLLIVDDEETTQLLFDLKFRKHSEYRLLHALNVKDAKQQLANESIDILITDLKMDGETGWDLLQFVKSQNVYHDIPVMIMTAYGSEANILKAKDAGAVDFFTKTVDFEELFAALSRSVKEKLTDTRQKVGTFWHTIS